MDLMRRVTNEVDGGFHQSWYQYRLKESIGQAHLIRSLHKSQQKQHARTARVKHSHSLPPRSPSQFTTSSICVAKKEIALCKNPPISTHIPRVHLPLQNNKPHQSQQQHSAMANMIMASSKPIIPPTCSLLNNKPKIQIPQLSFPKISKPQQLLSLSLSSTTLKSLSLIAATSLSFAPPSLAEEIEKAALFDFNLTLPIIMAEFLFLMFALDKIYYSPLGNFMDERDAAIKEKLNSVKDTSGEVKQLEEQATAIMRAARAEISAALTKMKKETQIEVEQKLAQGRRKVEAELQEALANLEKQKDDTIEALDSQIAALSQDIVKKVIPL